MSVTKIRPAKQDHGASVTDQRLTLLEHVVNQLMTRIQELESSKGIVKPFDLEPK